MPEDTNTILNGNPAPAPADGGVGGDPAVTPQDQTPPTPPNSGEYDFGKMVGEGGALADDWRDALPENIRGEKCLEQIKNVRTLAQSYVHAQHAIGANRVAIPGENATPEEWNAFYKACGRPDKEDDYKSDGVELPEGITLDDAELKHFREFAFRNGLSQKAYAAALAFDVARVQRRAAAAEQARQAEYDETLGKLRQEFGGQFETVVAQCNKALQTFGLADVLREHGLLNNYTIIKALAGIGGKISEARLKGAEGTPASGSPQSRLDEIRSNPDDPYYKKEHPAHAARVAEVSRLLAALAK